MARDDDETDEEIFRQLAAHVCPDLGRAAAVLEGNGVVEIVDLDVDAEAAAICRRHRERREAAFRICREHDPDTTPREEMIRLFDEAGVFAVGEDERTAALILAVRRLRQRCN
jgi:hypothetical protein